MSDRAPYAGKILSGLGGFGAPTPEAVEERARELARMDGRHEPNEADRSEALAELAGPIAPQTPEVPPEVESVTEWDESPSSVGTHFEAILPEDEAADDEILVNEGMEEADHEQRLSAADEDLPEEL